MMTATGPDLDSLAAAVAGRVRAVGAAVRRLDGLAPDGSADAGEATAADRRELALRMLRSAGRPDLDLLLRALEQGPQRTATLAELSGRGRLSLWESVADLIQVGLVTHDADRDEVCITSAGLAMLELVQICAHGSSRDKPGELA